MDFGDRARKETDRHLRRSILEALYLSRGLAPLKGLSGRFVVRQVNASVVAPDVRILDDGHAMGLLQDLADKELVVLERGTRLKGEAPSPDTVFVRVTDAGSRLYRQEADPDPDVYDLRATGEEA